MTVRRTHLVLALVALGAAVLYNVWYFALRPASPAAARPAGEPPLFAAAGAARPSGAAVDPLSIPAPPALDTDSAPSWRRDPFLFGDETRDAARRVAPAPQVLVPSVRSVLFSASRRLAIVDGRIVGVGESVGVYTVVEIERDAVIFAGPSGGRLRVPVHGPATEGPAR
jgi:hypothetical protein